MALESRTWRLRRPPPPTPAALSNDVVIVKRNVECPKPCSPHSQRSFRYGFGAELGRLGWTSIYTLLASSPLPLAGVCASTPSLSSAKGACLTLLCCQCIEASWPSTTTLRLSDLDVHPLPVAVSPSTNHGGRDAVSRC